MVNLTKILKGSGSLSEVLKNSLIRPNLRAMEVIGVDEVRLLEDEGKRLLEDSSTSDSTYISKNSETLTNINKS